MVLTRAHLGSGYRNEDAAGYLNSICVSVAVKYLLIPDDVTEQLLLPLQVLISCYISLVSPQLFRFAFLSIGPRSIGKRENCVFQASWPKKNFIGGVTNGS